MSTDRATHLARIAFVAGAWTFVACLAAQLFLVGLDLFEALGADSAIHREFAYLYGWLAPALVLLGMLARQPRRLMALTVGLLIAFAIQTYLPSLAEGAPQLAAFHAVNAVLVVTLAVSVALVARGQVGRRLQPGGP